MMGFVGQDWSWYGCEEPVRPRELQSDLLLRACFLGVAFKEALKLEV